MAWLRDECTVMFVICIVWLISSGETGASSNGIENNYYNGLTNEAECLQMGGTCLRTDECQYENRAPAGLCPKQQSNNVECCYGLSTKENRCEKLGGICRIKYECRENLQISQGTDCGSNDVCCALV